MGDGYGSAREVAGFMKMVGISGMGILDSLACLVYCISQIKISDMIKWYGVLREDGETYIQTNATNSSHLGLSKRRQQFPNGSCFSGCCSRSDD